MDSIYNQKKGGCNETYTIPWFKQALYTLSFVVVFAAACSKQSCPLQMDGRQSTSRARSKEQASPQHALVEHVADFENETLHKAASRGSVVVVKALLLAHRILVNTKDEDGFTALHLAARFNHAAVVKELLSVPAIDANIKTEDDWDWTALHLAAYYGCVAVVKELLSFPKIDANKKAKNNLTALHCAVQNKRVNNCNRVKVIKELGAVPGIRVNEQNNQGFTALHLAVEKGRVEVVKELVSIVDIQVNKRNNRGFAALHLAAYWGHEEVVQVLMADKRVDVRLRDPSGNTPLDLARARGHQACVDLLQYQSN